MADTNERTHPAYDLDQAEFSNAAAYAALRLEVDGVALVHLAPGDATVYKLLIARPTSYWNQGSPNDVPPATIIVGMTNCAGRFDAWDGYEVEPRDVARKWTTDHYEWTGVVLSRFLTSLAGLLL